VTERLSGSKTSRAEGALDASFGRKANRGGTTIFKTIRDERGFTVVELLVVLSILAILIAIVVHNLAGFLGRGKQSSFEADKDTIQAAVDAYYTGSATKNRWPTNGGGIGAAASTNYIDFSDLTTNRYLEAMPNSASGTYHTAPSTRSGSYGWYIDTSGTVQAWNGSGTGFNGNYP
jgi:prepilin-type N-terminal cleavage/methylation domain-containing protein